MNTHWYIHIHGWTHLHSICVHVHMHTDTCICDAYACTHEHAHTTSTHCVVHTCTHTHQAFTLHTQDTHIHTLTPHHTYTSTHTHTNTHTHTRAHTHTACKSDNFENSLVFSHTASILVSLERRRESRVWPTIRRCNSVGKMVLNFLPCYFRKWSILAIHPLFWFDFVAVLVFI